MPRRPSAKNRATPPTTGGSTIDSVHSARTAARPGNCTRASSHASGTPNRIENPVAHSEHTIDSRSAVRVVSSVRYCQTSPHGARQIRPTSGSAKNTIARIASTNTGHGIRARRTRGAGCGAARDSIDKLVTR